MKETRKYYSLYCDDSIRKMFAKRGWKKTEKLENADLLQLTGGIDVDPKVYNHIKHHVTQFTDPKRDEIETEAVMKAHDLRIPVAGICRGGQLLHAMAGGFLFQDIDKHNGPHTVTYGKREIMVSSSHHQAMGDPQIGEVLMYTNRAEKKIRTDGNGKITEEKKGFDIEAMLYPDKKWASFQPHPEWPGNQGTERAYFEIIDLLY